MDKTDIATLLDALCDRPFAEGGAEPSAELLAFCREAAAAQSAAAPGSDTTADADRLTAALASLLAGAGDESARQFVAEAAAQSAAMRLDAQSALVFVDALERSPQFAPAHLVEEMLAADRAAVTARQGGGMSGFLSLATGGSWLARRWGMIAACTVLLVAGAASMSIYWPHRSPSGGESAMPVATTTSEHPAVANAPAPSRPAVATTQPCETRGRSGDVAKVEAETVPGTPSASASGAANCSAEPGHQFADRPADEIEALAARRQAEAARQAAAAAAAARVGTAQADREPGSGAVQADRSGPMFGSGNFGRPAATFSAPAAAPAARPAPPVGMR